MPGHEKLFKGIFEKIPRRFRKSEVTRPSAPQEAVQEGLQPVVVFEEEKLRQSRRETREEDKRLTVIDKIFKEAEEKRHSEGFEFESLGRRLRRQGIIIRFAEVSDAPPLLRLFVQPSTRNHIAGVRVPRTEEEEKNELDKVRSFIKDKFNYVLVAVDQEGKIVGTETAQVQRAPLYRVVATRGAIDESVRRKGIGESLLRVIHGLTFLPKEKGGLNMGTVMAGVFITQSEKHHESLGEGSERPIRLLAKMDYINHNVILKNAALLWNYKLQRFVEKDVVQFSLSTRRGRWPGEAGTEKVVRSLVEGKTYKSLSLSRERHKGKAIKRKR